MSAPAQWREVALLDVCKLNPRQKPPIGDAKIDYVSYAGIDDATGRITASNERLFAEVPKGASNFREGDVLFAGVTSELWKSALVGELVHGVGMSPQLNVMRPGPELSAGYLWHFFQQPWLRQQAARMNTSTHSQPSVHHSFFRNLRITLPPIEEQLHLVDWLEQASVLPYRSALERVHHLKSTLTARLMLPSIKDIEPGWVPITLGDICRINPKYDAHGSTLTLGTEEVIFFSGRDPLTSELTSRLVRYSDLPTSAREARAGDVLFGAPQEKTVYGRVGVVPDSDTPKFVASTLTVLRPEPTVSSRYLSTLLRSSWFNAQVSNQTNAALRSSNDTGMLRRMRLVLPPLVEQQRIVAILDAVPLQAIQDALVKSRALYHALARDAFNGILSKRWHAPSPAHINVANPGSDDAAEPSESESTSLGAFKRTHRASAIDNLSKFQRLVWRAVRARTQALFVDDPNSFESFCTSRSLLPLRNIVSHNQVRRTLEQIAALGLIQKMSLPPRGKGDTSPYLTAFRAYRQSEVGRINEDTASRDAQSLRGSILEIDLGL